MFLVFVALDTHHVPGVRNSWCCCALGVHHALGIVVLVMFIVLLVLLCSRCSSCY
jgi:hypothetical protein